MALPLAISGNDVIGQARTGTGKTYAFGVAMLQRVGKPRKNRKKPRGLVVVPTRELALQVTEDLVVAGGKLGSRILTVYGGRAYEPQIESLKQGVDVVVGTPGRLLDLVSQKHLDLSQISMLVLDEADRMLDLGFLPDIERIMKLIPADRQTMLFSATMPGEIVTLSRRYLSRPTHVRAENADADSDSPSKTVQHVFRVHRMDKIEIVARVLQCEGRGLTMVFCETKRACDMVSEQLKERGFAAAAVHGDLGQGQREQALRAFRNGKVDVLVATDVAARGIDIDDVTHVINYDCPQDEKAYVHRIGRTGRAGRTGVALTFVEWEDLTRWKVINNALGLDFAEPVESYSTSPHIFAALGIPAGTKGVLPRAQRSRAGLAAEQVEDVGETGRHRSSVRRDREEERDRAERRERPARNRQRRRTRGGRTPESAEFETVPAVTETVEPLGTVAAPEPEAAVPAVSEEIVKPLYSEVAQGDILTSEPEAPAPRRSRRGAGKAAPSGAPAEVAPVAVRAEPRLEAVAPAPVAQEPLVDADEVRAPRRAPAQPRFQPEPDDEPLEPERIIPASPFSVIFRSPDLASVDDEVAPSAATERVQRRRPAFQRTPRKG
ncbi:DEAD/DEAH box helicase [Sphaerisporangium sp. TRM90804]|uniref:DEAD/DEAH box helicase n=1 Tax=Sphaerisporangium sp. TRM90804 TaxID=3031113 RepID=UPI00244A7721|nr:DEAD/DEAH box helicase [Sphaerisporangium sp. TRM90804]MDH2429842.1 DEAD/DEAH box helicase [Sphaerisporangium sp. TRM90804]